MGDLKIVFGIGNPGSQYKGTRHNFGFCIVERIAEVYGVQSWMLRCQALIAETEIGDSHVLLVKPVTYVNRCGISARAIFQIYGQITTNSFLVVVDEVSIPLGRIRLRRKGSSGGHRGVESIISHLGSDNFPRLRIGIGEDPQKQLASHVLSEFTPEEQKTVAEVEKISANAVIMWIQQGIEVSMNQYNGQFCSC